MGPQEVCVTENSWRPSLVAGGRLSGTMHSQHTSIVAPERKKRLPFSMVKSWNTKTMREMTEKMMDRIMKAWTALSASSWMYGRSPSQLKLVQFFHRPTDAFPISETTQTLAMVETNNIMTVAMWTTKMPASNTNILAF